MYLESKNMITKYLHKRQFLKSQVGPYNSKTRCLLPRERTTSGNVYGTLELSDVGPLVPELAPGLGASLERCRVVEMLEEKQVNIKVQSPRSTGREVLLASLQAEQKSTYIQSQINTMITQPESVPVKDSQVSVSSVKDSQVSVSSVMDSQVSVSSVTLPSQSGRSSWPSEWPGPRAQEAPAQTHPG